MIGQTNKQSLQMYLQYYVKNVRISFSSREQTNIYILFSPWNLVDFYISGLQFFFRFTILFLAE